MHHETINAATSGRRSRTIRVLLERAESLPAKDQMDLASTLIFCAARNLAGEAERAQVAELILMADRLDKLCANIVQEVGSNRPDAET